MVELGRVRVFREVAVRRSFSRAAEALSFTQPSVSHHVAALEAELGQRLINRSARPITLTAAGEVLLAASDVALAELERAEKELRSLAEGSSGRVSIGSVVTGLRTVVPAALARFRAAFPGVELELEELQAPQVLLGLRSGELDVGIISVAHDRTPPDPRMFDSHVLVEQALVLALPAGHRLAGRRRLRLQELSKEAWVLPRRERHAEFRDEVQRRFAESGVQPRRTLEVSDDVAGAGLVAAGVGVALLPDPGMLPIAGIVLVPVEPKAVRRLFALTIAGRTGVSTRALLDALKQVRFTSGTSMNA
jgi:DNA-binding transcriptional LysR family regulator